MLRVGIETTGYVAELATGGVESLFHTPRVRGMAVCLGAAEADYVEFLQAQETELDDHMECGDLVKRCDHLDEQAIFTRYAAACTQYMEAEGSQVGNTWVKALPSSVCVRVPE